MIRKVLPYSYGILLCAVTGIIGILLSFYIPLGAVSLTIITGIIVGNLAKPGEAFSKGISLCEKHLLSIAIALMGVKLNFLILKDLGLKSVALIICALAFTIFTSLVFSKLFKFDKKFSLLLGIGNGVCGSSAIAATEKIIGANEEEVGLSVAIVNFLGTLGIFILPFVATYILSLSETNSALLIGNTLQAVGQVVAAGFSISESAGQTATIIKMGRILMLLPLVLILTFTMGRVTRKDKSDSDENSKKPGIPLFIIGFALFSLIPSFQLLPKAGIDFISSISRYALIIAMAGIGLKITFKSILVNGKNALFIGSLIFLVQIFFSSIAILFLF